VFAAGRQLTLCLNDTLYYTLFDPIDVSLTLTTENGDPADYILYDAYGNPLTGNFSDPNLEATLQSRAR